MVLHGLLRRGAGAGGRHMLARVGADSQLRGGCRSGALVKPPGRRRGASPGALRMGGGGEACSRSFLSRCTATRGRPLASAGCKAPEQATQALRPGSPPGSPPHGAPPRPSHLRRALLRLLRLLHLHLRHRRRERLALAWAGQVLPGGEVGLWWTTGSRRAGGWGGHSTSSSRG
jgi:hypothetical protein